MVDWLLLKKKYLKDIKAYKIEDKISEKQSKFIQDGDNCRLFAYCNNLYFITGIEVDVEAYKKFLHWQGVNTNHWMDTMTAGLLMCDYARNSLWIDLVLNRLSVNTDIKLLAKLRMKGYVLIYSRDCGYKVLNDIGDNDQIDNVFSRSVGSQHVVNIHLPKNKKLVELGSRGNDNRYNSFTYKDTDVFVKSVEAGGINGFVYFLDYK